ncbi:hypothetical protein [Clostridium saccharoperbutylacetonicum]
MILIQVFIYGIYAIMLTIGTFICIEMFLELLVFRKRLNDYFFIVNKGFFFKNTVFMSVNKEGKNKMRVANRIQKGRILKQEIRDLIKLLPKNTKIKTKTHNAIKNMICEAEKNKLIKDLKVKKGFSKPLFLEKLSIGNKYKLLEFKKFYKISFIVT